MSLISGKEALNKITTGDVQYMHSSKTKDRWTTITSHYYPQYHLGMFLDDDSEFKFRLKPKTITLNGIEVPAPFEPKDGDRVFHVANTLCGYDEIRRFMNNHSSYYGFWRTEDEIKQVVEALRSVFK